MIGARRQKGNSRWGAEPSLSERLAVYLLLAHTLTEAAKIPEATKVRSETPVCLACIAILTILWSGSWGTHSFLCCQR